MKRLFKSKLVLTLAALIMIAAAVAIPLSGASQIRSHAQGTVTFTEFPIPTGGQSTSAHHERS